MLGAHSWPQEKRCAMAHITVFLGICCLVTISAQAQGNCSYKEQSSQQCGTLLFNANKYTCCGRDIHEGSHLACCGTSAYNVLNSSCCKDNVTHGLGQAVSECCGSNAYNPVNQICCGKDIKSRPSARAQCCVSDVINEEKQLCCNDTVMEKKSESYRCCGNNSYDSRTHCCCNTFNIRVENLSNECCSQYSSKTVYIPGTKKNHQTEYNHQSQMDTEARTDTHCEYNKDTHVCCSGKRYPKKSGLTQCCGAKVYQLWEEDALCCDGVLYHNQTAGSVCTGKAAYSPHSYTVCKGHVHLPAGQQCCGNETFDPHQEICCIGHRRRLVEGVVCCGSVTYNPNIPGYKCCSGHLYDLTGAADQSEAECCGPLLLRKNQRCCHSTEKTLVYEAQEGHSCCGHWYYNTSLWGCCAGRLIPLRQPLDREQHEFKFLPHLSDYNISAICRKNVLLGTVLSEAVNQTLRSVVLMDVLQMWNTTLTPHTSYHKVISIDHCSFPVLEAGRTYLWMLDGTEYVPVTNLTAVASPLYSILTHCLTLVQRHN